MQMKIATCAESANRPEFIGEATFYECSGACLDCSATISVDKTGNNLQ